MMHGGWTLLPIIAYVTCVFDVTSGFLSPSITKCGPTKRRCENENLAATKPGDLDLTTDGGVVVFGDNLPPPNQEKIPDGKKFVISYRTSLAERSWSAEEVVSCWLKGQQGLDDLADTFLSINIDETTLTDPEIFNEHFVIDKLGLAGTSKIKVKKLIMAARRLANIQGDFNVGDELDSNEHYAIEWGGKPKLISGMRIALEYMLAANLNYIAFETRCDYAYGSEGYRKSNGEVMIPPFATLEFKIDVVEPLQ